MTTKNKPVYNVLMTDMTGKTISYKNLFELYSWSLITKELKKLRTKYNKLTYQLIEADLAGNTEQIDDEILKTLSNDNIKLEEKYTYNNLTDLVLKRKLRSECMYYYWSKCEYEVIVKPWPSGSEDNEKKIDVFEQLEANWDIFFNIVKENL